MKEFIIIVGSTRSGKSTYAQKISKEKGHRYINFDTNFHYSGVGEFFKFLDFVGITLNDNPDKDFVLDGYIINYDNNFEYLKKKLRFHRIRPIIAWSPLDVILSKSPKGVTKKGILWTYKTLCQKCLNLDKCEFIDTSTGKKITYQKIFHSMLVKQDVVDFLERLKKRTPKNVNTKNNPVCHSNRDGNYDRYYQTIELPFGFKIQGYNVNYEHRSWPKIYNLFDFKGKKVADIGCFNGYFCFKIKECGAKEVHGLDRCIPAIQTAKEISWLKGLDIKFKVFNIEKDEIRGKYDVILSLNMLHYLEKIETALDKIFSKSKAVILEIQFSNISKEKVTEIAKKHGHKLKKQVTSDRPNRFIMLYN